MYMSAVFLPLLGSLIAGLLALFEPLGAGKAVKNRIDVVAQWTTCGLLVSSMLLAWFIFFHVAIGGNPVTINLFKWVTSGTLDVSWTLRIDQLTAVMMIVVTTVSAMVHIYSVGYMRNDSSISRFHAYLSFFTFAMLMLITADNLLQLFFGWEGVGVASYLLIGFWYDKPSANAAAIKAFIVNRVGDFGFALGILATYMLFNSINLGDIFVTVKEQADTTFTIFGGEFHALTAICLLLFLGAMGKSAQFGLHTWLPDAMEGPTPVSALIHAATMVTAGIFMVARLSPLFEHSDTALLVITYVGAVTAIFAAMVGCVQNDIKRVIAYSTCSQLGYMFFACGVSAYSAGIFHLMTHGFFKALLFLGAGSVIHAMSDEQDMRKMGGIWHHIKLTYILMWIGSLALAGIPPFSGYFSKDIILEAAWGAHSEIGNLAFWFGIIAAFLTAFYSWRLLIMTFHGAPRADERIMAHIHESPKIIIIPLFILALGAIGAGWLGYESFIGHNAAQFWGNSIFILDGHKALKHAHHLPTWVKFAPLVASIAGIGFAYVMYIVAPVLPGKMANIFRSIYDLLFHKWWFDELYNCLFVRPIFKIGRSLWKGGDEALIDGIGPDGIASVVRVVAGKAGRLQSGFIYHYAFAMLIGVVFLITWHLVARG